MEPRGLLLCSHTTGPYPKADESSPHCDTLFKIHINIILPPTPRSSV